MLRLKSPTWEAGASAQASISLERDAPATLRAHVRAATDDGRASEHDETFRVAVRPATSIRDEKPSGDDGDEP